MGVVHLEGCGGCGSLGRGVVGVAHLVRMW